MKSIHDEIINLFFETKGKLTVFRKYTTLVMLGVSVSFAIIKLVLNIVRYNTGA